jgi:YidC/Oxa1 family membrane protein insertase
MDRRLIMFFVVSFALMVGYTMLMQKFAPPAEKAPIAQAEKKGGEAGKAEAEKKGEGKKPAEKENAEKPADQAAAEKKENEPGENGEKKPEEKAAVEAAEPVIPEECLMLGSVDPDSPYRMGVTVTNRGAAVMRIELSQTNFRDIDIRSGYLGHIITDPKGKVAGCPVQLIGAGSPAEKAGLKVGDVIVSAAGQDVKSIDDLKKILGRTRPDQTIELGIVRGGKPETLSATLTRYPLEVVRPAYPLEMMPVPEDGPLRMNYDDPFSLLMTMQQIDDVKIADNTEIAKAIEDAEKEKRLSDIDKAALAEKTNKENLVREIKGIALRDSVWQKVEADQEHVVFAKKLPKFNLEVRKTYRLAKVPEASMQDANYAAYHLTLKVEVVNLSDKERNVAYRLDGPNGLPTEGYWYANKVSRNWGGAGLRDVVVSFDHGTPTMVSCATISDLTKTEVWRSQSVTYIGVDAQYFSSVLIPKLKQPLDNWFDESYAVAVGSIDPLHKNWTNTSFRLIGLPNKIEPRGTFAQEYQLFAGPKKPDIIDQYGLSELVYYGWPIFGMVAKPMTWILHTFYEVVQNYGIAIILLTVLVRGCMFPLSFKQTLNAQKMALIQPEMKKISEKYKKDVEARNKAIQELYRKHNTNPFSGCLVIFIQLPIFLGLYRSLMVDVQLRDAPLISSAVRWCSNLAAPDMLFYWRHYMPEFAFNWLGPYFNILPVLTIFLFLWQQHKMMPPPTDEQQAMQQKMMKYMMIFMGVMFFKVASGLCIYFIASSLWGLGERKFLPKKLTAGPAADDSPRKPPSPGSNGDGGRGKRKKDRDRK